MKETTEGMLKGFGFSSKPFLMSYLPAGLFGDKLCMLIHMILKP